MSRDLPGIFNTDQGSQFTSEAFAPLGDEVVTLLDQQDADVRLRPYWNSSSECRRYTLRRGEGGGRP